MKLTTSKDPTLQYTKILVYGDSGVGKCLGKGTPILMFDGSTKPVEQICDGNLLMGPDSAPRKVSGSHSGYGSLFRVIPKKGDPYVVNKGHILSLKHTNHRRTRSVNMPVEQFASEAGSFRYLAKGWRTGVEWPERNDLPLDPYLLGCWLGDGSLGTPNVTTPDSEVAQAMTAFASQFEDLRVVKRASCGKANTLAIARPNPKASVKNDFQEALRAAGVLGKKHIPLTYRASSNRQRRELLAGLIDSDGYLVSGCYEISQKTDEMAESILFLARSLGLAAYGQLKESCCQTANGLFRAVYHRIIISGAIDSIPVRIPRRKASPRKQRKNVLLTGITVQPHGEGEFFGFDLDRDHLFLLGDFTVTHNTTSLKTLPVDGTLIAVGERGLKPLEECKPPYNVLPFRSWPDLRELCLDFLEPETPKTAEEEVRRNTIDATKMLVIDSLCEVSELCMREIIEVDRRRLIDERTKGKRDTPENVYEDQMQLEDWGLYGTRMFRLLSTLSHLPVHMICTCRVRCSYDKQGNEKQRMPNLGGRQLPKDCPAYFGEVFHMEAAIDDNDNPIRVWRTSYNNTSFAKDETGKLNPFEETDWTKLLTKILGDKKK